MPNQVPKVWKIYIDLLILKNIEEINLCSTTLLALSNLKHTKHGM
jgi:hypothetical protein